MIAKTTPRLAEPPEPITGFGGQPVVLPRERGASNKPPMATGMVPPPPDTATTYPPMVEPPPIQGGFGPPPLVGAVDPSSPPVLPIQGDFGPTPFAGAEDPVAPLPLGQPPDALAPPVPADHIVNEHGLLGGETVDPHPPSYPYDPPESMYATPGGNELAGSDLAYGSGPNPTTGQWDDGLAHSGAADYINSQQGLAGATLAANTAGIGGEGVTYSSSGSKGARMVGGTPKALPADALTRPAAPLPVYTGRGPYSYTPDPNGGKWGAPPSRYTGHGTVGHGRPNWRFRHTYNALNPPPPPTVTQTVDPFGGDR